MKRRSVLVVAAGLLMAGWALADDGPAEPVTAVFSLDELSFISFGDRVVVPLPAGSTITFEFGVPGADGAIPFTISPQGVHIDPVPIEDGTQTLVYDLGAPATGWLHETPSGRKVEFTASLEATLVSGARSGTFEYTMPFTTELAVARSLGGSDQLERTGLRLVDGVWYGQLVGSATNKANAFPEPGAAVYSVLSGTFDQVP